MLFKLIASTPRFLMNYKAPGNVYDSPKITLGILNCTMKALLNKSRKTDVLLVSGDVNYILSGVLTAQKKGTWNQLCALTSERCPNKLTSH